MVNPVQTIRTLNKVKIFWLLTSGMLIILLRLQMNNKDFYVLLGKVLSINSHASLMVFLWGLGFPPDMRPVCATLRHTGYTITSFIGDTLICYISYSGCLKAVHTPSSLLQML